METLETLQRKITGASDLKSVVRTMKAMAASNIGQYEMAVKALADYYQTVSLGISACFKNEKEVYVPRELKKGKNVYAIVFGSEQGLIGQFNDLIADLAIKSLNELPGTNAVWCIGTKVQDRLSESGFATEKTFSVPNSVNAITTLIGQILSKIQEYTMKDESVVFYLFHNRPKTGTEYVPVSQRLLPLDKEWKKEFEKVAWPTKKRPEILGDFIPVLAALIREYLFVSIYKACAESLASENAARLASMQRAETNIEDLLEDFRNKFHRLRQSTIDEELFDVVSGFEALKG